MISSLPFNHQYPHEASNIGFSIFPLAFLFCYSHASNQGCQPVSHPAASHEQPIIFMFVSFNVCLISVNLFKIYVYTYLKNGIYCILYVQFIHFELRTRYAYTIFIHTIRYMFYIIFV